MGPDYWTPEAVEMLIELSHRRMTYGKIAEILSERFGPTTKMAVSSKRGRLGLIPEKHKRVAPVSLVQRIVADAYGITVHEIKCNKRARNLMVPRQIAMALAYEMCGLGYTSLARSFARTDHTTILHGANQAREKFPEDIERMRVAVLDALRDGYTPVKKEPEPEEVIVPEPVEVEKRADKFEPRKVRPARIIQREVRARDVTGSLLGDPGFASQRVARGEISRCDG